MPAYDLVRAPYAGQVVDPVPLFEQLGEGEQPLARAAVELEAELLQAAVELLLGVGRGRGIGLGAHAALFCAGIPRFRCTSSSEIAAGVTPEMRAACPNVSGL